MANNRDRERKGSQPVKKWRRVHVYLTHRHAVMMDSLRSSGLTSTTAIRTIIDQAAGAGIPILREPPPPPSL